MTAGVNWFRGARNGRRLVGACAGLFVSGLAVSALALPVFTGSTGGAISFGVAGIGPPISPGVPTYLLNNFNGRTDILTNPGIGATANPVVANNTSSVASLGWLPGGNIFNVQVGGGNINGLFGAGTAVVTGPTFGYALSDGGIPGGVSTSYEIMSWNANFNDAAGTPANTIGTFITMGGVLPLVQDLAMVSLRTRLVGSTLGAIELPGLILAAERTGPLTYSFLALQDNAVPGAFPMGGGWAMLINAPTGQFRGLAYNVLPFAIPAGELLTAQVTATVYSDPSFLQLIDPADHPDLIAAAVASNNTPFPASFLFQQQGIPESTAIPLLLFGWLGYLIQRRNERA